MARKSTALKFCMISVASMALGLSSASALDTNPESRNKSGTHQFYVQCVGGVQNYTLKEKGANAKEALKKVKAKVEQEHGTACYPNWEGLES